MKKIKIFIACDTTNLTKAKKIINQTKTNKIKIGYKFGLEFMSSKRGRQFISKLKNKLKIEIPKIENPNLQISKLNISKFRSCVWKNLNKLTTGNFVHVSFFQIFSLGTNL